MLFHIPLTASLASVNVSFSPSTTPLNVQLSLENVSAILSLKFEKSSFRPSIVSTIFFLVSSNFSPHSWNFCFISAIFSDTVVFISLNTLIMSSLRSFTNPTISSIASSNTLVMSSHISITMGSPTSAYLAAANGEIRVSTKPLSKSQIYSTPPRKAPLIPSHIFSAPCLIFSPSPVNNPTRISNNPLITATTPAIVFIQSVDISIKALIMGIRIAPSHLAVTSIALNTTSHTDFIPPKAAFNLSKASFRFSISSAIPLFSTSGLRASTTLLIVSLTLSITSLSPP